MYLLRSVKYLVKVTKYFSIVKIVEEEKENIFRRKIVFSLIKGKKCGIITNKRRLINGKGDKRYGKRY